MAYQKVEVGTWKPEKENDSIEGVFIRAEENVGENKSRLYHLEVEQKPIAIWGSAVLDIKMSTVKPGDKIKIVFLGTGKAQKGHNAPKLFDVYIDRE
jgi:hypothetical protein